MGTEIATVADTVSDPSPVKLTTMMTLLAGGLLYGTEEDFAGKVAAMRREFDPVTIPQMMMVERAIQAIFRLRNAAGAEVAGKFDNNLMRYEKQASDVMMKAFKELERGGDRREAPAKKAAASPPTPTLEIERLKVESRRSSEPAGQSLDRGTVPNPAQQAQLAEDGWRTRLTFDPAVSTTSPVVRGTWVTAQRIGSLVVDDWTWADLLVSHPELTEEDIRACLAYCFEEGSGESSP